MNVAEGKQKTKKEVVENKKGLPLLCEMGDGIR